VRVTPPLVTVCILAGHGLESLDACLRSLEAQERPPSFELIVGINGRQQETELILRRFPTARLVVKRPGNPGAARNALIHIARGDLLLFLDDDVTVAPDLLRRVAELDALHPEAAVFGGPNDTPQLSSRFQVVQGAVLGSLVGAGPVSRRYGARHPGPADERWFTLCNLAVRRAAMLPFADELVCAEENAMLAQLQARGEAMHYDPSLRVFHARRPTWKGFARQMFKYGHGRGQLLVRDRRTFRAAYLAPGLLVLYAAALAVALPTGLLGRRWPLALVPLAVYLGGVLAGAARIAATLRRAHALPLAAALTVTVHVCYGLGVLRGLASRRARQASRSAATASFGPALEE
jgi:succinoglycan biosynthesis protein ExoA